MKIELQMAIENPEFKIVDNASPVLNRIICAINLFSKKTIKADVSSGKITISPKQELIELADRIERLTNVEKPTF